MNPLDPIYGAGVPSWPFVYVIGSYDSRITFFSQQVRAFNLVAALATAGMLHSKTRFAVIGGGAAGLSAAAGLSLLRPHCYVDVFERETHPLHLQRRCLQRNLHPHIYEWPRQGSRERRANLPFLDWEAGTANAVADAVMQQFGTLQAYRPGRLALKTLHEVTGIERIDARAYRLHYHAQGGAPSSATYHAVFIAIGFGRERRLANAPWNSYWSDRGVPDAPRYADRETTVLVSGAGDGGLIDLCAAVLQDFDHTALIELVTAWPGIEGISNELIQIDLESERVGRGFDFVAAYDRNIGPRLRRDGLVGEIAGRIRQRVRTTFNTKRNEPLEQPTSTLNRLLVYLLFTAAQEIGLPIQHLPGAISAEAARPGAYEIAGTHITADELFVRHGPAKREAFAPFEEIRTAYEGQHELWLAADRHRQTPPRMNPEASHALSLALADSSIPVPRHLYAAAVAQQPQKVRIGIRTENAEIIWSGSIRSRELVTWWGNPGCTLRVECAAAPGDLGSLACAVARFIIHARQLRVESDDSRWNDWLTALTRRSPHAQAVQHPITVPVVPSHMQSTAIDRDVVAGELHAAMDLWTLDRVSDHLAGYLAFGNEPDNWITWEIHPALRAEMARRWASWHIRLRADSALLSRLFRLAACTVEDDDGDIVDRQVLVGPARLPNIIRSITLALVAAEAWPISAPRNVAPGNFDRRALDGAEIATIHVSGADLIDGRNIMMMASQHAWRTSFVLLSELTASISFEQAGQRLLTDAGIGTARLDASPTPCNVIVGADLGIQVAMGAGTNAVATYLADTEARLQKQWRAQIDTGGPEG